MTFLMNKRTWLAVLAVVFAWSVPADAGPRGKKDEALDQALKSGLPQVEYRVIIETVDHAAQSADNAIKSSGGRGFRQLISFPGRVVTVNAAQLAKLEKSPLVKNIYLDRPTAGENQTTSATTGALLARAFMGYTGAGVGVAVIDSGIAGWHDDLTYNGGTSAVHVSGGQRVAGFYDFVNGQTAPYDDHGHGTHVAGIIAGNGYDSYGARAGIAPAAHIVSLKVLDAEGGGFMSDVIAAFDWAVANRDAYAIRVINISVGARVTSSYWNDPLTLAAKRAVDAGIVVVAAAGNNGKNAAGVVQYGGITAPGNAPWVLTVGASSHQGTVSRNDDVVSTFSSRGPTAIDFGAKPDLVAPGTGIVSLAAPGSTLYLTKATALASGSRSTVAKPYISLSGTSMAAPVVAGTVALMLQANPALTPNAVKAILQYTAQPDSGYNALVQGAGFLNGFGAVELSKYFRSPADGSRYPNKTFWGRSIIWGNHQISGGAILPWANAWATNIVWGTTFNADGDNIVWGTVLAEGDNIVWGTSLYSADGDNIVWGTILSQDGDNIVWGTTVGDGDNIVWGTDCGGNDCAGIVWGAMTLSADGDNIVWGTAMDGDNIVWGTALDGDNIVWGTSFSDADNIVWGTSAEFGDNIVWGTSDGDGTTFEDGIVEVPVEFQDVTEPAPAAADSDSPPDSATSGTTEPAPASSDSGGAPDSDASGTTSSTEGM